ncbi:MAG TPA: hypothetical protein VK774_03305 [Solirubrobacteraceae bacterium]|jgi:hypothetical protein|nr:hypothetical protein [Solirubrobacteraceae bacterium]
MLRFVSSGSTGVELRPAPIDGRAPRSSVSREIAPVDWLILFAAFEGAPEGLDPVRLQQGLFLFSRCPAVPPPSKYVFEPGIYGPVSNELYADLYRLAGARVLEPRPVKGLTWCLYKPIDTTFEQARESLRLAESDDLDDATRRLAEIKQYVSNVDSGELLEHVYSEHPEFAVNSAFRGAA